MPLPGTKKAVIATDPSPRRDSINVSNNAQDAKEKKREQEEVEDKSDTKDDTKGAVDSDAKMEKDNANEAEAEKDRHVEEDPEQGGKGAEEEDENYEDGEGEAEELEHSDEEEARKAVNIDLSCMKTLYQFRNRPTLPYLLTEYGMEDKDAPVKKQKEKKKKKRSFGDDAGRDRERDKLQEERHLQIVDDMTKLRDYYYDEYSTLLQNKVDQQRHDIRQRSNAMQKKLAQKEETERQERHHVKRRLERHAFVSDDSFLQDLPKTDLYHIVQLQDKLIKEGTLKSQSDFDSFWQRIQQPDIFYLYFNVPKREEVKDDADSNDNASSKAASSHKGSSVKGARRSPPPWVKDGQLRALSRITETVESRASNHWAVTQQFPSQHRSERRRSSFTGLSKPLPQAHPRSSFLVELEKRFPKLEMPKLHCFTMNLGPKPPDPDEVRYAIHLREMEKTRKKYTYKLSRMYQLAMANAAAASRILEQQEDMDFIINGSPLTDLISDQHFYSGLPLTQSTDMSGATCSSPVAGAPTLRQFGLPSLREQDETVQSEAQSAALSAAQSRKTSRTSTSRKKKRSPKPVSADVHVEKRPSPTLVPLSLGEVVDNTQIMHSKCMSTMWINYMKEEPEAKT